MNFKNLNTTMISLNKSNNIIKNQCSASDQDKQNTLINRYEAKEKEKKAIQKCFEQIQKRIMKQKLKEIVGGNVQYFRNICNPFYYSLVQVKQSYKPNSQTLKLPGKTAYSLYQSQFTKRKLYCSHYKSSQVGMHNNNCDKTQNYSQSKFTLKTTYQVFFLQQKNQFKKLEEIKQNQQNKKINKINKFSVRSSVINAPSFMQTQNSLQYRNWGTGSVMPLMKPSQTPATTEAAFNASTVYRSDFHSIVFPKTPLLTQEETHKYKNNIWMGKSSYEQDFNKKKVGGPGFDYKPKEASGATNLPFKSTTEYKQSFMKDRQANSIKLSNLKKQMPLKLANQDIERLVLNL